jgi:hypothetical protein
MIIARGTLEKPNSELLILGLSKKNMERLQAGQPIRVSRPTHGEGIPEGWEIVIFTGETEDAMHKAMEPLFDSDTKTFRDSRLGSSDDT